MRTSNEIGAQAEKRANKILGGKLVPGSGSQWRIKLDITDKSKFVYSVKASTTLKGTATRAISLLWREAISGTRGFSGHGNEVKPGLIFELPSGEMLVVCRLEDHVDISKSENKTDSVISSNAELRRKKASKI